MFNDEFKDLPKRALTLEILESSALGDMQRIVQAILDISKLGIKIAIDDFGTGHATLNYLKDLPVDIIKIDQVFVRNIFLQPNNVSILEAIASMAEAFEMEVIAEGVETQEHIKLLLQLGIEHMQGYGISHPIPEEEVLNWINTYQKPMAIAKTHKLNLNGRNFLKAKLYHYAWNKKVKEHILDNGPLTRSENSYESCPFGRWLQGKSGEIVNDKNLLSEITNEHINVHQIAHKAELAYKQNDLPMAKKYLEELDKQTDVILQKLDKASHLSLDVANVDND